MTTYYVSPAGSDNNNGTASTSTFATLQKAADVVHAGDTVLAMDGTYTTPLSSFDVHGTSYGTTPHELNNNGAFIVTVGHN